MHTQTKAHCYPLSKAQVVTNIYSCLEMLRLERADLADWWCNLIYTYEGDIHYPSWNALTLLAMENDCIFHMSHEA